MGNDRGGGPRQLKRRLSQSRASDAGDAALQRALLESFARAATTNASVGYTQVTGKEGRRQSSVGVAGRILQVQTSTVQHRSRRQQYGPVVSTGLERRGRYFDIECSFTSSCCTVHSPTSRWTLGAGRRSMMRRERRETDGEYVRSALGRRLRTAPDIFAMEAQAASNGRHLSRSM